MVRKRHSLTGSGPAGERHQGFRALGETVSRLAAPVVVKRGGILVRLKAEWQAIVGDDWAAAAWPAAFGRDGVLKLHTRPAAALELQHCAPLLIDRINLYLGCTAVSRLILVQVTFPFIAATVEPASRLPEAEGAEALDNARLAGIADPGLRAALRRLARAMTATRD